MPGTDYKNASVSDRELQQTRLNMPVIGLESEFNVWLDEVEIDPKPFWRHPSAFIDRPLLPREKSSLQLPTGALLLAIRTAAGQFVANPAPDTRLDPDTILIALGTPAQLSAIRSHVDASH